MYNFDLRPFIFIGAILVMLIWGGWELFRFFILKDKITTEVRIDPELKLIIRDNKVDTIFIYKKP